MRDDVFHPRYPAWTPPSPSYDFTFWSQSLPVPTSVPPYSQRQRGAAPPGPPGPSNVEPPPRQPSAGTVWTIGGAAVTDAVPVTGNGRGGYMTSGSTAEHHFANFLGTGEHPPDPSSYFGRVSARDQDERELKSLHWRRLATAMGMVKQRRTLAHSSPVDSFGTAYVFKDGRWMVDGVPPGSQPTASVSTLSANLKSTPAQRHPRPPPRPVPTVPYRVLEASGLRDDYYCSLLAYSPVDGCLAVGLGAQVYL